MLRLDSASSHSQTSSTQKPAKGKHKTGSPLGVENPLLAPITQAESSQVATVQSDSFQNRSDEPPSAPVAKAASSQQPLGLLKHFLQTTAKADSTQPKPAKPKDVSELPTIQVTSPSSSNPSSTGLTRQGALSSHPMQRTAHRHAQSPHPVNRLPQPGGSGQYTPSQASSTVRGGHQPYVVYMSPQDALGFYGIAPFPAKAKHGNALSPRMANRLQPMAREMAGTFRQTFNSNIALLSDDPDLKRPAIIALQKELGYRIPVIDFSKIPDRNPQKPFLSFLLENLYADLRDRAKVPTGKPLVLYLKNTNPNTLYLLQTEATAKAILQKRNVRLIIDRVPVSHDNGSYMGGHGYAPSLGKPVGFKTVHVKSLKPSEWLGLLKGSYEADYLQKKYHCTLTEMQLKQLLHVVLRENDGKLTKQAVLESLDSLGAFIKLKYSLHRFSPVQPINHADLQEFFAREGLLSPPSGPVHTKFSFELQHGLENLAGLEEPKKVLKVISDYFKYGALSKSIQKGNPFVKTILIDGPPGIGKTMFAEGAAKELEKTTQMPVTFVSTHGGSFSTGKRFKEAEDAVHEFFDRIEEADTPLVVAFVDEVEGIYNRKHSDSANAAVETDMRAATNAFLTRSQELLSTSKKKVLLVYATNDKTRLDSAFADRVNYQFSLSNPGKAEQQQILRQNFDMYGMQHDDALVNQVIRKMQMLSLNLSGRQLAAFVEQLRDEAFETMSGKSEKNRQMELGLLQSAPLKMTDALIDKVLNRFAQAIQAGRMTQQQAMNMGIV